MVVDKLHTIYGVGILHCNKKFSTCFPDGDILLNKSLCKENANLFQMK